MQPCTLPDSPANPPQYEHSLEPNRLPRQVRNDPVLNPQPHLLPGGYYSFRTLSFSVL